MQIKLWLRMLKIDSYRQDCLTTAAVDFPLYDSLTRAFLLLWKLIFLWYAVCMQWNMQTRGWGCIQLICNSFSTLLMFESVCSLLTCCKLLGIIFSRSIKGLFSIWIYFPSKRCRILSVIYINKTCIFGIIQVFLYLPLFVFLCSSDGGDNDKAIWTSPCIGTTRPL